jgi:hypothetical protein
LITFLKEVLGELEREPIVFEFDYEGKTYRGEATPVSQTCKDGVCSQFELTVDDESLGIIQRAKKGWKMTQLKDQKLVNAIGYEISRWNKP